MAPQSTAELEAELAELRAKRRAIAGVRSSTYSDQSTTFDQDGLDKRIAQIEQQLAQCARGGTTRYAATSKGC